MKEKINETLAELMAGIVVSGVVIQIADLIISAIFPQFKSARFLFATGLWIGVAAALLLSIHMYRSIDRALDMSSGDAETYMRKTYMLRTLAILAIAAAVHFLQLGYVMATFLGVLCLKFGAFLQPLMHTLWKKGG
jgi:hypothetical protein